MGEPVVIFDKTRNSRKTVIVKGFDATPSKEYGGFYNPAGTIYDEKGLYHVLEGGEPTTMTYSQLVGILGDANYFPMAGRKQ
jgi:hypothetical protein